MECCLQKTLSFMIPSSLRSRLTSKFRNGLNTALKNKEYNHSFVNQQLPDVFTKNYCTLDHRMLPTECGNVHQVLSHSALLTDCVSWWKNNHLFKRHRRAAAGSGPFVQKNKFTDEVNFTESENEYFHAHLESLLEYQPYFLSSLYGKEMTILQEETVARLIQEVREKNKIKNLLLLLEHWSSVAISETRDVLVDKSFSQTVKLLGKYAHRLPTKEVINCLVNLNRLGFRQSFLTSAEHRYNRILASKSFDKVCSKHIKKFTVKELLLVADFFYSVRGSSFTDFPFLMCEKLKLFLPSMTKPELILLLFHMGLTRKQFPLLISAVVEHLKQDMNSLSLQELGIINLAHYKTQSIINQPAFFIAVTKQLETVFGQEMNSVCLSALLKYQRKSLNRFKDQFVPQFFVTTKNMAGPLIPRISELPPETLMHVLNLYYSLDLMTEDIFMTVVDRILHKGVNSWRLKDLARVTHILTNIPMGAEAKMEALATILANLQRDERQTERCTFPACLLETALALTYCNVYPHWLFEEIFSDFSQGRFKDLSKGYRYDLYHLSESISIEDDSYIGPLLRADNFPNLPKNKVYTKVYKSNKMSNFSADGTEFFSRDWILLDLMDSLIKVCPDVTVLPVFLLSHFQTPDLEIQLQIVDEDKKKTSRQQLSVANSDFVSNAVVLHASSAYQRVQFRDGKTIPLLRQYHAMRARQLRKMGATVVEIPHFEFEETSDKSQYLLTKLKAEEERKLGHELD